MKFGAGVGALPESDPAPSQAPPLPFPRLLTRWVFPPLVLEANPHSCRFAVRVVHITFILLINDG